MEVRTDSMILFEREYLIKISCPDPLACLEGRCQFGDLVLLPKLAINEPSIYINLLLLHVLFLLLQDLVKAALRVNQSADHFFRTHL